SLRKCRPQHLAGTWHPRRRFLAWQELQAPATARNWKSSDSLRCPEWSESPEFRRSREQCRDQRRRSHNRDNGQLQLEQLAIRAAYDPTWRPVIVLIHPPGDPREYRRNSRRGPFFM